jgi:hypothetical protein
MLFSHLCLGDPNIRRRGSATPAGELGHLQLPRAAIYRVRPVNGSGKMISASGRMHDLAKKKSVIWCL